MADRRLQVFHAVAKNLSFTKAAEALYMTQPAVTFQIKQLEEHFNTRLFDRGHGRISLTPAGELALEYADRILGEYADLEARLAEMTGQMRGPLLVGASITIAEFMLPRVLGEFNALYPNVRARLVVGNSETIENRVAEHSLDLGITEAIEHLPQLQAETCCDDELQVICSPSHPLARESAITPAMLRDHAFIAREPGSGTREVTDNYFRQAGVDQATAVFDEEAAKYRQSVLQAFKEVEDNLAHLRLLDRQSASQDQAVQSAARAARLSQLQYREGALSYLGVLDADRSVLQQRRAAVQLDGDRARATVALIRAIGGSWGEGGKDGVQDAGKGGEAAPAPALPAPAEAPLARVEGMAPAR